MPIAIIVVALSALAIVYIIALKRSALRLKFKDWFEIDGRTRAPSDDAHLLESSFPTNEMGNQTIKKELEEVHRSGDQDTSIVVDAADPNNGHILISTNDASELERSFKSLRDDPESLISKDIEFWETYYTKRLANLMKRDPAPALIELAANQQEWSWPLVYLVRHYSSSGRINEAKEQLEIALTRQRSTGYTQVLAEGVEFNFRVGSAEKAWAFLKERVPDAKDSDVAAMVGTLSELEQAANPCFGNIVLTEIEVGLDNSRYNSLWKLAYGYGEHAFSELLAYRRYRELVLADESVPGSLNNMGVIAGSYESVLGTMHQEEAVEKGDLYAIGNIADRLIRAGFLERAKGLLESTDDNTTPTILRARTALQEALDERAKKVDELRELAMAEGNRVRSLALSAYGQFVDGGLTENGDYVSAAGDASVKVSPEGALCSIHIDDRQFEGHLAKFALGYGGSVTSLKPGETLLTSQSRHVLLMLTSEKTLSVVVFDADRKFDPITILTVTRSRQPRDSDVD